jgi:hypothetical protein
MSGLGVKHVWQKPLETGPNARYVRFTFEFWSMDRFSRICTSPTHSMHPLDSMELLGLK